MNLRTHLWHYGVKAPTYQPKAHDFCFCYSIALGSSLNWVNYAVDCPGIDWQAEASQRVRGWLE